MDKLSPTLYTLHFMFSHSGDKIVAHCLDIDIATSAATIEDAEHKLTRLVQFQIATCCSEDGKASFTPAPQIDWDSLSHATMLPPSKIEIEVPPHALKVTRKQAQTTGKKPASRHEISVLRIQSDKTAA